MIRIAKLLLIIAVIFCFCGELKVYAVENSPEDEYNHQLDEVLSEYDIDLGSEEIKDVTFSGIMEKAAEKTGVSRENVLGLLGTVIVVALVSAVLKSAGSGFINDSPELYSAVCNITAAAVIMPPVFSTFSRTLEAVKLGGGFLTAFIPVFAGITAVSGGIATAGVYDVAVLAASELILQLSGSFLMPLLSASAMLSVTGSVFKGADMSGMVQLIKKTVTWLLTSSMLLFTGFVTLKCTLAGKADGAASKTVRFMISGLVPVVGGAVTDAYATVRSSFEVIRGTVGTAGCFAIILIMLPPVIQIMIFRLVMWTGAAVAELFGEDSMSKLLKSFDSALAVAQSVLICYGLMFILCTAILLRNAG
ncbi:MAG: hypothetical protein IKW96_03520 [Ruminococcus sp.]|uniref:stage III sporulation protein AE n=1 Tax=Ruminococcus sp. TaxID=41978 RepID=UPI0025D7A836|nr:hypothetical protein [Ruminococcus sp.]MBR5682339.1 hypothetical protein [Ruminococcus sp.]